MTSAVVVRLVTVLTAISLGSVQTSRDEVRFVSRDAISHWLRRLLAGTLAALVYLLGVTSASAATFPELETRVGAIAPAVHVSVGPHECITVGQRWGNAPPQAVSMVATGVAAKTACFTPGTPVLLADGTSRAIEDVQVGDKVTAYDPDTGKAETRNVVRTFVHHNVPTHDVMLSTGEKVTTTEEHPFWVEGKGWTPATQLKTGDHLRQPDGSLARVASAQVTGKTATVYNFEVRGLHDYYVQAGNTWILVHNACDVAGLARAAERHVAGGAKNIHASTFWDGTDLAQLADTSGAIGLRQANGNIQYVMSRDASVGVDFQTGLPTNVYTVIRKPSGDLVTIFPGTTTAKLG